MAITVGSRGEVQEGGGLCQDTHDDDDDDHYYY
jgi:hypothetical protein